MAPAPAPASAVGSPLTAVLLLVAANLLIPLAIGIFGKGFFPYKPLLPGLAQYEDNGFGPPAPAPFDRVVFMVVDALRSDFVYAANSGFEFTQSLIRSGSAVPFTAHATSPTVTMPRIKAITTGSIPSFLDVVLNVDEGDKSSSLASQDTWLAQMKAKKADSTGKLVLYGDDTWLKLFPDTFDRADGTSSFFVADFTEVDANVTRHVAGELRNDDWGVLVLHYLGLDHIGHKGGPRSPHMVPKQREMDAIVRDIYAALEGQPHLASTLLVLCGDHGMNDAGNHGASSAGEVSPALVFVSPKLRGPLTEAKLRAGTGDGTGGTDGTATTHDARKAPLDSRDDFQFYRTVEQSDLAPTLAALLGFPAPQNNLGALIPEFLALWPDRRDQVQILMHNAHQILRILTAAFGDELFAADAAPPSPAMCTDPASDVEELACAWHTIVTTAPRTLESLADANADAYDQWVAATVQWLRSAQRTMSGMASNYDMPKLGLGLAAAGSGLVLSLVAAYLLVLPSAGALTLAPFALITLTYGVMMFASSYVEEEHHFWYWALSGWVALAGLRSFSRSPSSPSSSSSSSRSAFVAVAAAFAAVRLVRAWNQTGQKFAGAPDVVKAFLQPSPALLWTLVLAVYVVTAYELIGGFVALGGQVSSVGVTAPAIVLLVWSAFSFKLVFTFEDSPELVGSFARPLVDGILQLSQIGAGGGGGGGDGDGNGNGASSLVARARVVFSGLGLAAAAATYLVLLRPKSASPTNQPTPRTQILLPVYTLLAVTQSRTTNIPLFLLFGVLFRVLAAASTAASATAAHLAPADLTTAVLLLQYASFFAFGGTNAISSVDLSSAYNGISGFSAAAVGVLTFVGNWAGAIYWAVAAAILLHKQRQRQKEDSVLRIWLQHASLLTVFAAASAVAVMAACTALRTHLFVWTVFSPKYLYCVAWNLGMHLAVNLGLGGLVYWLGTF